MTDNTSHTTGGGSSMSLALPAGIELGHYRLLHKIGQGGFGITYLAENLQSHEQVVIKENLPTFYASRNKDTLHVSPLDVANAEEDYAHTLERFVEEARTLARLHHPNIVRVYEAFEALGTAYYVMPYIPGKELHKAIPAVVDEAWLLPILRAVLEALEYLHSQNLLHRDLKPGNILLQDDGTPMLIDFGTARALQSERSATMIGTPGYTPFEQITPHGKRGPWTDLYALGATCYRVITGELPPQSVERIDEEDPYRPLTNRAELRKHFSPTFLQAIDTALAVRAKKRWQSAREWLEVLPAVDQTTQQPVTQSLPVSSIPTSSPATDEKKNVLSRKSHPIILAILLLALSGGVYGVYSCTQSATEKRMREEFAQAEMMNQLAREKAEREAKDEAERLAREKAEREAKEEAERLAREKAEREAKEKAKKDAQDKLKSMGITDYDEAILKYYENPETLQLLITAGADVNKADKDGETPLTGAAYKGHTECVKLLLAAPGIDVNKANKYGNTPLYRAAWNGHTEIVKLLLSAPGIDISNWNALSIAVLKNDCNTIKQLLQSGADVNKADKGGETPLYWAATLGHTECVKLLLAAPGIEVNKANKYGYTPLYRAASNGHTECVKLLLAAPGIEVNKANENGWTPLQLAASNDHTECVKLLLAAPGIDVNKADEHGITPLYLAAFDGHTECVKLLLAAPGIDVNKTTPLYTAASKGHTECVKLLLAAPGIDVNEGIWGGRTPLIIAAYEGHTECVKLLLAAPGIDISNWNALSIAVLKNDCNTIKQLLQSGADVNKADKYGYTPLSWAASIGHTECVKLLLAAPGIDVNKAHRYGQTPLYRAAYNGHTECVKLLLAAPGIDVNKAEVYGRTPLYTAAQEGHTECVKLLLAAPGIEVNKAGWEGTTPLYCAKNNNHTECVELLRAAGAKE